MTLTEVAKGLQIEDELTAGIRACWGRLIFVALGFSYLVWMAAR